jgi:hypothetical protein
MPRAKTLSRNALVVLVTAALVFAGAEAAPASIGAAPYAATGALTTATQKSFTPKISGSAAVGLTLTITGKPSGSTLSYKWKRNGAAISGATKSTYKVATADLGKKLTVSVTSKRGGYTTLTKTSAATATVVKRFTSHSAAISGTARVGSKLTAKTAAWSPTPTFSYQWYRNGVAISGATSSTRTLTSSDQGKKITVKITGRKSGYLTTSKTSAATAAVAAAPAAVVPPAAGTFPAGAKVDYQLGGAYAPPAGVGIVTRDNSDSPAAGLWNVCYINGFQTQPGASWSSTLVLHNSSGQAVEDAGWEGEYLLDTSTSARRSGIATVLNKVVDTCASKGFNAVEFDNLDSYTRSGKRLTADNNIAMAKLLVDHAHSRGLLAAQKNTGELSQRLRTEAGFDFAISEECVEYGECADYTKVYGNKVFDVEYSDNSLSLDQVCASSQRPASTVFRDRDLVAKGQKGYVYGACS